jgi:hypothetical protein
LTSSPPDYFSLSSPLADMRRTTAEGKVNLTFPLSLSPLPVELSQLCKGQFPPQMHREIDGAVIISKNEKNLDCSVTFVAEYVTQKFLIRFDEFHMECGDQLNIYDSSTAVGNARVRDMNRIIPILYIHMNIVFIIIQLKMAAIFPLILVLVLPMLILIFGALSSASI